MGQTFNDFKFLYGVIKGITDLDFAFSRLTFTHNCQKNIPIFEDFFGLNSFSELATDEKFKNYKRIEISIPDLIKEYGLNPEKIKLNLNKKQGIMYVVKNWSDEKVKGSPLGPWGQLEKQQKLRSEIWKVGNKGQWLRNPILKKCFFSEKAVRFRKKISEQSIFHKTNDRKLLICYRLGDISIHQTDKGLKDCLSNVFHPSWKHAINARRESVKPFIEVDLYLEAIKESLKKRPNTSAALISDGFPNKKRETEQYLRPIINYCNNKYSIGDGIPETLVSLQTIFDADSFIFAYKGFPNLRQIFCEDDAEYIKVS